MAFGTYPPAPFLQGKGRKALLMVCIPSCFDGFGRMDRAMNPKNLSRKSLAKPILVPPFLAGTGVAYNDA